jgi:hypothetical protein
MTELIARSEICALRVCEGCHATLTVAATSLHLDREVLRHLAWFIREAERRLVLREEHGPNYKLEPDLRR